MFAVEKKRTVVVVVVAVIGAAAGTVEPFVETPLVGFVAVRAVMLFAAVGCVACLIGLLALNCCYSCLMSFRLLFFERRKNKKFKNYNKYQVLK